MIGRKLSRYRITGELGAGGMGVVYRAHDEALDREVALKVLPPEFAAEPLRRERFEREARAAARLSHPGIVQIHDFGIVDGVAYTVSELVEGRSLRDVLAGRRLPWREAVTLGVQIAQALASAHANGVVHRDLKPENIMLDDRSRPKVLDFGLAQILAPPPAPAPAVEGDAPTVPATLLALTRDGTVLGTAGYMAPEQVRGVACDARTDVFALGCLLHELLTGRRAFQAATPAETMGAVLRDEPPPPSSSDPEIPPVVDRIIARCLAKRPSDRFSSAHDVALSLEAISDHRPGPRLKDGFPARRSRLVAAVAAAAVILVAVAALVFLVPGGESTGEGHAGPAPPASGPATGLGELDPELVAVMPLENRTGDPALDPLGLMAADWIAQRLAGTEVVRAVPVIGPLGPGLGPDAPQGMRDLADATGAGIVVSGAYYLLADTLRFHASVSDVIHGELIYSAEAAAPNALPMQGIDALQASLVSAVTMNTIGLPSRQEPPTFEAYREYIAGLESFGADYERAILHFRRALELAPDFVPARLRIATALMNQGRLAESQAEFERLEPHRHRMATPFLRGLPTCAWPTSVACAALHMLGRHDEELAWTAEAYEFCGESPMLHEIRLQALAALGRIEELERELEEVLASPAGVAAGGRLLAVAAQELRAHGHPEHAAGVAGRALRWRLEHGTSPRRLAEAHLLVGDPQAARRILEELAGRPPAGEEPEIDLLGLLGVAAARADDREAAQSLADRIAASRRPYLLGEDKYWRAAIAAGLGESKSAVELLRRAFTEGKQYGDEVHRDPYLEPLWDMPEFQRLLEPRDGPSTSGR
ncbi:MAG: protein kinase [Candidatus Krumholzibacteriia bacterium]